MRTSIAAIAVLAAAATSVATPALAQPSVTDSAAASVSLPRMGKSIGWSAAIRHQTDLWDGKGSLVLVSPQGALSTVGKVADNTAVVDVDAQRQLVLTETITGEGLDQTSLTVWNLNTGKQTHAKPPSGHQWTSPQLAGGNLLLSDGDPSGKTLTQVRSVSGALVRSFPQLGGGLGSSPGGRLAYESTTERIYERNLTTGSVRSTPLPSAVRDAGQCGYAGMWSAGQVKVFCTDDGMTARGRSMSITTANGRSAMLSPQGTGIAMPTTPKTVNVPSGDFGEGGQEVRVAQSGGGYKKLSLGAASSVIGAVGSTAYVLNVPDGGNLETDLWLGRYDLKTNKLTKLAGHGSGSGGVVTSAITVDGRH